MKHTDYTIIGTGIVGLSIALGLNKNKEKITIIGPKPTLPPKFSVCAINDSTRSLWEFIDLWPTIENKITPIHHMQLKCSSVEASLHAIAHHRTQLGWILPNHITLQGLIDLCQKENITWIEEKPLSITEFDKVEIKTPSHHLKSKWVVAADGRKSWVRSYLNKRPSIKSWDQKTTSMIISHTNPHSYIARQYFLPSGPVATLPLKKNNQSCLVWSYINELDKNNLSNLEKLFPELGTIKVIEKGHSITLCSHIMDSFVHGKIIFAGDAAHTVHPIAGLGMNLGIIDALLLCKNTQMNILDRLKEYNHQALKYQSFMAQSIHSMVHLSRSNLMPFALQTCKLSPMIQRAMILQANGREWIS